MLEYVKLERVIEDLVTDRLEGIERRIGSSALKVLVKKLKKYETEITP